MSKTKYLYVLLLICITIISVNALSAADYNQTNENQESDNILISENNYQVDDSNELNRVIDTIKSSESNEKNIINLENGTYDSFNLNLDDNVDLEINGNNQIISADITINIGNNSKLTINSLTLNHTGKTKAIINNDGILRLNNVQLTNSHIVGLEVISGKSVKVLEDFDDLLHERADVMNGKIYNDSSAITIVNNYKLYLDNCYYYGNVVNTSLITNNYLTSVENCDFENNYANSIFINNGKLRINNTKIGINYLNSLISIDSEDISFEPESYIANSNITYTALHHPRYKSFIVEGAYFSTIFIKNSYLSDFIDPYWYYSESEGFGFVGREISYNNSEFNSIKFFNNERKNYVENYQNQFNKYFEDKEVPKINVTYDGISSTIRVVLTDINGNYVEDGTVDVIVDDKKIATGNIQNGKCTINLFDKYVICEAEEIYITYNGNDNYSSVSQYYNNVFYDDMGFYYSFDDDYYYGIRSIPGLKRSPYEMRLSVTIDGEDLRNLFNPLDEAPIEVQVHTVSKEGKAIYGEIPENSRLHFYVNDNLADDEIEFKGYNSKEKIYSYRYRIPENVSNHYIDIIVKLTNPEHIRILESTYLIVNITEDENDDEIIDATINVSNIYQDGNNVVIEGQVYVDYPDFAYTRDIYIQNQGKYDFYDVEYFTGKYQIVRDFSKIVDGNNSVNINYFDWIDEYLDLEKNITFEVDKKNNDLLLKSYTIDNVTTVLNITNDTNETEEKNNTPISYDENDLIKKNTKINQGNANKNILVKQSAKSNISNNNNQIILEKGFKVTLSWLNKLFGEDFSNQTILIYLDDILVYNGTVSDNYSEILFEILSDYVGNHVLKIENGDDIRELNVTIK